MAPSFLRLSGATRLNRNAVLSGINAAIMAAGGWVVDFSLLSNMAATIRFAIPETKAQALGAGLTTAGVSLFAESLDAIAARPGRDDGTEVMGYVQVTFLHDEPDLRRAVPAVPG